MELSRRDFLMVLAVVPLALVTNLQGGASNQRRMALSQADSMPPSASVYFRHMDVDRTEYQIEDRISGWRSLSKTSIGVYQDMGVLP